MLNNDNIKEIVIDLDKLSIRSDEVNVLKDNTEVREIIVELKNTLREYKTGVGLAAPQIGKYVRIFVINFNGDLRTFINPVIINSENITLNREGCLSLPGKEYILPRFGTISVMYQDPQGKTQTVKLMGMAAFVFQHELDHLDGVLISDIGLEIDKDFDNATQEERDEIIKMYLESLDIKTKTSAKEVEEDPELKKMNDSIKFMEKVQKGEVQIEQREFTEEEKARMKDKIDKINDIKLGEFANYNFSIINYNDYACIHYYTNNYDIEGFIRLDRAEYAIKPTKEAKLTKLEKEELYSVILEHWDNISKKYNIKEIPNYKELK